MLLGLDRPIHRRLHPHVPHLQLTFPFRQQLNDVQVAVPRREMQRGPAAGVEVVHRASLLIGRGVQQPGHLLDESLTRRLVQPGGFEQDVRRGPIGRAIDASGRLSGPSWLLAEGVPPGAGLGVCGEIASHHRGVLALFNRGEDLREQRFAKLHVRRAFHGRRLVSELIVVWRAQKCLTALSAGETQEPKKNGRLSVSSSLKPLPPLGTERVILFGADRSSQTGKTRLDALL